MHHVSERYIDDGWEEVGVQDSLYGMQAQELRDLPEAAVISAHAHELCEEGRGRSTFQGLYVIYQSNVARWETEWDYRRVGQPGSGATIRDDIELEAPSVEEFLGALRIEREQSLAQSYIRAVVFDKAKVLQTFRLPAERLLK